jgi:hypothetical protein
MKLPESHYDIKLPEIIIGSTDFRDDRLYGWKYEYNPPGYKLMPVTRRSKKSIRLATEILAAYFRREFDYDSRQYDHDEETDDADRIFLIQGGEMYCQRLAVGAICFRWREYRDGRHGLALSWIWLHPYLRRTGLLTKCWGHLRNLYGDFLVAQPLSKAMKEFLKKHGECWFCGRTHSCKYCQPV